VIAVVAVAPLAVGTRYSVLGAGNFGALLADIFCCAKRASFDSDFAGLAGALGTSTAGGRDEAGD